VKAKLTVFSKSEGDDDLSALRFVCLAKEQQTPCTTEQVTAHCRGRYGNTENGPCAYWVANLLTHFT
jgi:hypothetical protein